MSTGINFIKSQLKKIAAVKAYTVTRKAKRAYPIEHELINNRHSTTSQHRSILHYSMNRSASQFTKKILRQCCAENELHPVDLHGYAFNTKYPFLGNLSEEELADYYCAFREKGYLYSNFLSLITAIPNISNYLILMMLRDPRDILVSRYFSKGISHTIPNSDGSKYDNFMNTRRIANELSIDEFALFSADKIFYNLLEYKKLSEENHANVKLIRFEDMVLDFDKWLDGLLSFCELKVSDETIQTIKGWNKRSAPKVENIKAHNRKGIIGDYRTKLQPETIEKLNDKFAPILDAFGYDRS